MRKPIMLLLATLFLNTVPAFAANKDDINKVIEFVKGRGVDALLHKKQPLGIKDVSIGEDDGTVGVTLVFEGKEFSVHYIPVSRYSGERSLSYWIRTENTSGRCVGAFKAILTDWDIDGQVDSGGGCPEEGPTSDQRVFVAKDYGSMKRQGLAFRSLWQWHYDEAVAATLRYIAANSNKK